MKKSEKEHKARNGSQKNCLYVSYTSCGGQGMVGKGAAVFLYGIAAIAPIYAFLRRGRRFLYDLIDG